MRAFVYVLAVFTTVFIGGCGETKKEDPKEKVAQLELKKTNFTWEGANIYFLLTDRFMNGDPSNDTNYNRTNETALLRGFEGGDIKGVTQKVREGYFTDLGISAIWMTPIVEQIHDGVDEGTGYTYGYHGYWTKDWTAMDPNFGTREELQELVTTAHDKGIRIILDAVINHHGPETEIDGVWPQDWVRTSPKCEFTTYENTTACTLVDNLPDILTESNTEVELPPQLVEKWKAEGRYEEEVAELDAFFKRTGHPRAPRFYIMKWLSDYITDFGVDGYRVDTVKHTEEYVWEEFRTECDYAFANWKETNPNLAMDDAPFYMVGEIYFYDLNAGQVYDFGDKKVDYFGKSFDALINFNLRSTRDKPLEEVFSSYAQILNTEMDGFGTLNYVSSHDDGEPYDKARENTFESAIRLLLAPGASQVYYGDEVGRTLIVEGTNGDATLRSNMDWDDINSNAETKKLLAHWQKLGQFRNNHMAVGAGTHQMITDFPYTFSRTYNEDKVVVALNAIGGVKKIAVATIFEDGTKVQDAYSGQVAEVTNGTVTITSEFDIVLLELAN